MTTKPHTHTHKPHENLAVERSPARIYVTQVRSRGCAFSIYVTDLSDTQNYEDGKSDGMVGSGGATERPQRAFKTSPEHPLPHKIKGEFLRKDGRKRQHLASCRWTQSREGGQRVCVAQCVCLSHLREAGDTKQRFQVTFFLN